MFQTYAQIENGNVVSYPVDPHIEDQFGELIDLIYAFGSNHGVHWSEESRTGLPQQSA